MNTEQTIFDTWRAWAAGTNTACLWRAIDVLTDELRARGPHQGPTPDPVHQLQQAIRYYLASLQALT